HTAFPGHQIALAPPLVDGLIRYTAGTPSTVDNYARDVAAFLSWTADPSLEARKALGWQVLLYLLVTTVLLYLGKRVIWRDVH
ncbi:MAG: cytochrome c1, partial [Hyphomicrobiaceae bacterium]